MTAERRRPMTPGARKRGARAGLVVAEAELPGPEDVLLVHVMPAGDDGE